MKKLIAFLLLSMFFGSCNNSNNGAHSEDSKEESLLKARMIFTTPDSLRSTDEKELFKQIEQAMRGGEFVTLKDVGYAVQYEITVSKEEWKKRGLPEIYYEIFQHDIACSNEGLLDTITFPKQLVIDAFHARQAEYLSEND